MTFNEMLALMLLLEDEPAEPYIKGFWTRYSGLDYNKKQHVWVPENKDAPLDKPLWFMITEVKPSLREVEDMVYMPSNEAIDTDPVVYIIHDYHIKESFGRHCKEAGISIIEETMKKPLVYSMF